MAFILLLLEKVGLDFGYDKNKYAAIDTGRAAFYGVGIAIIVCAIIIVIEMIKAGSF